MKYTIAIVLFFMTSLSACKEEIKESNRSIEEMERDLESLFKQNEKYENYVKENQKRLEEIKVIQQEYLNKYKRFGDSLASLPHE